LIMWLVRDKFQYRLIQKKSVRNISSSAELVLLKIRLVLQVARLLVVLWAWLAKFKGLKEQTKLLMRLNGYKVVVVAPWRAPTFDQRGLESHPPLSFSTDLKSNPKLTLETLGMRLLIWQKSNGRRFGWRRNWLQGSKLGLYEIFYDNLAPNHGSSSQLGAVSLFYVCPRSLA
jgi:hypothetical protein